MKRTLLFRVALCAMLMMAPAAANAQGKAFKKLLKMDGVEHVHIPKFLIKLAAKNGEGLHVGDNTVIGGDGAGDILKDIKTVDVFNCENKEVTEKMSKRVKSILSGSGWEALIDVKDGEGEKVKIYQNQHGKQTTVAIFAEEENEASLVVIDGEMDMAKLIEQQMASENNAEKEQN